MQGKIAYIRPKVVGSFPGPCKSELRALDCPFLLLLKFNARIIQFVTHDLVTLNSGGMHLMLFKFKLETDLHGVLDVYGSFMLAFCDKQCHRF
jgi:hypothetical protein